MSLEISVAKTKTELEDLFRFRYGIYIEEFRLSPLEADHKHKILRDYLDDYAISYVLRSQSKIVGSLRILFLEDIPCTQSLIKKFHLASAIDNFGLSAICATSRFMVAPELRHSRAIWKLMEAVYQDARQRGVRLNYGDCSPSLLPFYEHLGYRRYCPGYDDPSYGYKFPLLMLMEDVRGLTLVRSPLRRLARRYTENHQVRQWFEREYPLYQELESAAFLSKEKFGEKVSQYLNTHSLYQVSLFQGLKLTEIYKLLKGATIIHTQVGDRIAKQGDYDKTLYILLSGIAKVTKNELVDEPFNLLGAGNTFVEIDIFKSGLCRANLISCSPSEVLVIPTESYQNIIEQEPELASKLILNLLCEMNYPKQVRKSFPILRLTTNLTTETV